MIRAPDVRSILVMQYKFIGDAVLASVLIRNLRRAYPQAEITFLCAAGLEGFIERLGIADRALPVFRERLRSSIFSKTSEIARLTRLLRPRRFDISIDLTDTKTSRILTRLFNARQRVGYDPPEKGWKRFERQPANVLATTYGDGPHYLDRYLSPLQALGIETVDRVPSLTPAPQQERIALDLLERAGLASKGFVAVHAGASGEGRRWPPERFAATLDRIYDETGLRSVIIGGPDEAVLATRIVALMHSPSVSLAGLLPLDELLSLLGHAQVFFGNESGPMHLAAAVGTPVVAMFGLTDPAVWGPLGVRAISLRPSMPCPCVMPALCKPNETGNVYCVRRLSVDEVSDALTAMIDATWPQVEEPNEDQAIMLQQRV